jgi:uncharacterized membrane protein
MSQENRQVGASGPKTGSWVLILLPILLAAVYFALLFLVLPYDEFLNLAGMVVAYLVPPAGKETVIPIGVFLGLPWWLVAFTMAFLDVIGSLFMVWNFHFARSIPVAGPLIDRMMKTGRAYFDERPWLERLYFAGLVIFVMIPFEGSGGIAGSILGKLLGMRGRDIVICVATGAFISCFAIAFAADSFHQWTGGNLLTGIAALTIVLMAAGCGIVAWRAFKKRRKRDTD